MEGLKDDPRGYKAVMGTLITRQCGKIAIFDEDFSGGRNIQTAE